MDRIRVTVLWRFVAPAKRPKGFDGADPDSYGSIWTSFDNLIREAYARGIRVNLNVTGASPG